MSNYRSRGVTPSQQTATTLRALTNAIGDHEVARLLGLSRSTVGRLCGRLPVLESVLFTAEARLPALVAHESANA